jgi:hypothetical protein
LDNKHNSKELVTRESHFTRRYKLTFGSVALKILHSFADSVEYNIATFFPKLNIPPITASAFSIARYKLKIDLFLDLNNRMYDFIGTLPKRSWKGYSLVAGDGTTVNIPVNGDTIRHFGINKDTKTGGKTVLADACMLYDVLSSHVLGARISPFGNDEKNILAELLNEAKPSNTIIILDRGFSCFYIAKMLQHMNLDFCIRLKTNGLLFAKKILDSPSNDFVLDWIPTEAEKCTAQKKGQDIGPIRVRATKVVLPGGELEVLITSLLDIEEFTAQDINELYRLRWNIEEGYKKLKPKMKLEQFGCKKTEGIYQEFYSHIFMMNLTTLVGNQAQEIISGKTQKRRHRYRYNWTNAYKFIRNSWTTLYQSIDKESVIEDIIAMIVKSKIAVVPDRSFIRAGRSGKKHRYSPMYK